jgi:hypothetical protein
MADANSNSDDTGSLDRSVREEKENDEVDVELEVRFVPNLRNHVSWSGHATVCLY